MNRLADETSPYLLQHAGNPVDWYAWGDDDETIEAYEDLGFDVVERVQGWELIL